MTGSCSGGLQDQCAGFGVTQAEMATANLELDETADPRVTDHANLGAGQQTHLHEAAAERSLTPDFHYPGTGPDREFTEIGHAAVSPGILITVFNIYGAGFGPAIVSL